MSPSATKPETKIAMNKILVVPPYSYSGPGRRLAQLLRGMTYRRSPAHRIAQSPLTRARAAVRSCDPHDAGMRAPPRRRHFTASVVALILSATAPHGAAQPTGGSGWTGPDFSLYVSAEEAVVVSIRTSTSRRDRTEDPECPAGLDRESPCLGPQRAAARPRNARSRPASSSAARATS